MVSFKRITESARASILTELRREIWLTTYRGIYPDSELDQYDYEKHEQRDRARIADLQNFVYYIYYNGSAAGYLIFREENGIYISALYVRREFQRRGIGAQAFRLVRSRCSERGFASFRCNCNSHNLPAQGFYEGMGGLVVHTDIGHENPQEDQLTYEFSV